MNKPILNWIPFDHQKPPSGLSDTENGYLILIADYGMNPTENTEPTYHIDIATAYGSYIDDFWDTENDWDEGQTLHVIGYCSIGDEVILKVPVQVAYICDGRACLSEECNKNIACHHTLDVSHAQNFYEADTNKYMENEFTNCKETEENIPND